MRNGLHFDLALETADFDLGLVLSRLQSGIGGGELLFKAFDLVEVHVLDPLVLVLEQG